MPEFSYFDSENTREWAWITETFDDLGRLVSRVTEFDNGVLRTDQFDPDQGFLTHRLVQDLNDQFDWTEQETGQLSPGSEWDLSIDRYETTLFDSGIEKRIEVSFADRVLLRYVDGSDDGSAAGYQSVTFTGGPFGYISHQAIHDDGVEVSLSFYKGARTAKTMVDVADAHDWASITTQFAFPDFDDPSVKKIIYDNGLIREQYFSDGQLTRVEETDGSDGGALKPWESVITHFRSDGGVESRETTLDDGRLVYVRHQSEDVVWRVEELEADRAPHVGMMSRYEDGALTGRVHAQSWEVLEGFFNSLMGAAPSFDDALF